MTYKSPILWDDGELSNGIGSIWFYFMTYIVHTFAQSVKVPYIQYILHLNYFIYRAATGQFIMKRRIHLYGGGV